MKEKYCSIKKLIFLFFQEAASGNCADSWKAAGGERGDGALGELP